MPEKNEKQKRCPRGSRRNAKTGLCVSVIPATNPIIPPTEPVVFLHPEQQDALPRPIPATNPTTKQKRCPKGTRRNKTGNCVATGNPLNPAKPQMKSVVVKPVLVKPQTGSNALAKRRIGRFMLTHRKKITATYLAHVCTDANECMAVGLVERNRIRSFFDEFTTFTYATAPIQFEPSNSVNGRVAVVKYTREKYNASALLKIANSGEADSPYYEYTVGVFVNTHLLHRFPCFTETYGLLRVDQSIRTKLSAGKSIVPRDNSALIKSILSTTPLAKLTNDTIIIGDACRDGASLGLLTQYFADTWSLYDLMTQQSIYCEQNAYGILFQIYGPLAAVHNNFTHYDLHARNVLLVSAPAGKYFQMHYHVPGKSTAVTFNTKYLVKIIDYGRCFFKDDSDPLVSSTHMAKQVCATKKCLGNCGNDNGFWLDPANPMKPVQIVSSRRNRSIDLLLAYTFLREINSAGLNKVMYALPPTKFRTPELNDAPDKFNTVTALSTYLVACLTHPLAITQNVFQYSTRVVHGHLHVYLDDTDRSMRWENP